MKPKYFKCFGFKILILLFLLLQQKALSPLRTRIAPTPSGYLHFGNALSFVMTWALARAHDGWILLRIDDMDTSRRRPEYVEDIFRTLEWLGLDYDAGPSGPEDLINNYSQQLRLPGYDEALNKLKNQGYLYACACSRKDMQALPDGNFVCDCKNLDRAFDAPKTAWRLSISESTEACYQEWKRGPTCEPIQKLMGDFVVRQKNESPSYQLTSLVDDQYWDINFIVRGEDLRPSTVAQMHLADLLGITTFQTATFWHHELIFNAEGYKLGKSAGAESMQCWRDEGRNPAMIFKTAARWLGLDEGEVANATHLLASLKQQMTEE